MANKDSYDLYFLDGSWRERGGRFEDSKEGEFIKGQVVWIFEKLIQLIRLSRARFRGWGMEYSSRLLVWVVYRNQVFILMLRIKIRP